MLSRNERIRIVAKALQENPKIMDLVTSDEADWPELLADLQALIADILSRDGIQDKDGLSHRIVLELASFTGGLQIYLPQGDFLCDRIINELMKQEFHSGSSIFQLSRRFKFSEVHVRRIING